MTKWEGQSYVTSYYRKQTELSLLWFASLIFLHQVFELLTYTTNGKSEKETLSISMHFGVWIPWGRGCIDSNSIYIYMTDKSKDISSLVTKIKGRIIVSSSHWLLKLKLRV